jgi:transcriptional regulator with XRE-family HTH domain
MSRSSECFDASGEIRRQRLAILLEALAAQGFSQNQVAQRTGMPPSYVSDCKLGSRPVSELFARRLAEQFRFDYRWLLGEVGTADSLTLGAEVAQEESHSLWLPVFPHPIEGPPGSHRDWDGLSIELGAPAAAHARAAEQPYVLRFEGKDHAARLHKRDLILISQTRNDDAEIQVVRVQRKLFLARRLGLEQWQRVVGSSVIEGIRQVAGHCVGILWSPLCAPSRAVS